MNQQNNYYFRTEKFQKMVLRSIAQYGKILNFASKIGIDGSNFNSKTGINLDRWKNPTAESLAKIAMFYEVPIDFFFTDADTAEAFSPKTCKACEEKERIIESKQETIDAQRIAIDSLQKAVSMMQKNSAAELETAQSIQTA